jgi:uncharacterized protein Yka (UPF0111/DUF47 family)
MANEPGTAVGDRIVAGTEQYVSRVEACVTLVPELLEGYVEGGPYRATAERIRTLESECDHAGRRVSAAITTASAEQVGLRNSRVHINSPQVVSLFQTLDEVANAAEQVAEELLTVRPPTGAPFDRLREMADRATEAMAALAGAVVAFVRALCDPADSVTLVDEVEAVRESESACDRLRNDAVATAFDDAPAAEALLYREFALLLDGLLDAMEDVTDRIVLISSNESWVRTQADRDPTTAE